MCVCIHAQLSLTLMDTKFIHACMHHVYMHIHTQCDPSEATWQVINSIVLSEDENKFMFLGGGCSLDTEPLAALAGRYYQIPFVSLS